MVIILSLSVLLQLLSDVSALSLSVSPRINHVKSNQTARFMCKADVPITGCEFKVEQSIEYDFNEGLLSTSTEEYKYFGSGLENGECGIEIFVTRRNAYRMYGCRVRTDASGWFYKEMLLHVSDKDRLSYSIDHEDMAVPPGSNVTVLARSDRALSLCHYKWPTHEAGQYLDESTSTTSYAYNGSGLEHSDCGITLFNVQNSGLLVTQAVSKQEDPMRTAINFLSLRIIRHPLLHVEKQEYNEAETLNALCTIHGNPSQVSWYLDEDLIQKDMTDSKEWRWSFKEYNLTVELSGILEWSDDGKLLTCKFGEEGSNTILLKINYSPRIGTVLPVNLTEGEEGLVQVQVHANPEPTLYWTFGNDLISEKDWTPASSRIYTWRNSQVKRNMAVAFLHFNSVVASDCKKALIITAENQLGATSYIIELHVERLQINETTINSTETVLSLDTVNHHVNDTDNTMVIAIGSSLFIVVFLILMTSLIVYIRRNQQLSSPLPEAEPFHD